MLAPEETCVLPTALFEENRLLTVGHMARWCFFHVLLDCLATILLQFNFVVLTLLGIKKLQVNVIELFINNPCLSVKVVGLGRD